MICSFSFCDDLIILHIDNHILVNTKDELGPDGTVYHIWERVYITNNMIRNREIGRRFWRKWELVDCG